MNETGDLQIECGFSTRFLLPGIALALEEESPLDCRQQLFSRALIITVIGLVVCGQPNHRGMMKIIIPESVKFGPTLICAAQQVGVLRLTFANDQHAPSWRCPSRRPA